MISEHIVICQVLWKLLQHKLFQCCCRVIWMCKNKACVNFALAFRVNQELLALLDARVFQDATAQRYKPSWISWGLCLAVSGNEEKALIFPPINNHFDLFLFVTLLTRKNLAVTRGRINAAFMCKIDNEIIHVEHVFCLTENPFSSFKIWKT